MNRLFAVTSLVALIGVIFSAAYASEPNIQLLQKQFQTMPMEARRFIAPFFWMHGTESKDRLGLYIDKVMEGHNGGFIAESRPHNDWLGPRWYSDLDICLQDAKKNNLKMWIYDEKWWPSQAVGGKVPARYAAKQLETMAIPVDGPATFSQDGFGDEHLVAVIAGRVLPDGIDGNSLMRLTPRNGKVTWDVPAGKWQVMKFTWGLAPHSAQSGEVTVDGASKDCVDWFLQTVYQPHFDRFKNDFGTTIPGFFYDEPETQGDWGTELSKTFAERGVDENKAMVAWKFGLSGNDQIAAKYAYIDGLTETWGRTMYGGITKWCDDRRVESIGHFMDHDGLYLKRGLGATNIFDMQKYSAMGGMDLVCNQLRPGMRYRTTVAGRRSDEIYQLAKMASSISHAYNKPQDLTMCEIYGGYGQNLTYPDMKWLLDWHELSGVNLFVPHSFNPKAPNDGDFPPYFYADDAEPRWPLYRVWADYTNRLSLMLTGGKHVCPIAFLFCGNSVHVGEATTPEGMTTIIQDALYDSDWIPYEVFEKRAALAAKSVNLYDERYQVLIVPPVEAIPYATLLKVKQFFDKGGIVIGYDFLPSKSATLGRSSSEIVSLTESIWGTGQQGQKCCKTNMNGGRSYYLPKDITPEQLQQILTQAGVPPALRVAQGKTDNWLHVLHRVKSGRDVFFVCNQNLDDKPRSFRLRVKAKGQPELWDAMRNEITAIAYKRIRADEVQFDLTMQPSESALIVFQAHSTALPAPKTPRVVIPVVASRRPDAQKPVTFDGCSWIWYPEGNPRRSAPAGSRWFSKDIVLPQRKIKSARFLISADDEYVLSINNKKAGSSSGADIWKNPKALDVTQALNSGSNNIIIEAMNHGPNPNPAGLIGRLLVEFSDGKSITENIDASWQASNDSKTWTAAQVIGKFGDAPWAEMATVVRRSEAFTDSFKVSKKPGSAYIVLDGVTEGASVKVNGAFAGGMIGAPYRLNVSSLIKPGNNTIEIEPYAPKSVRVVVY